MMVFYVSIYTRCDQRADVPVQKPRSDVISNEANSYIRVFKSCIDRVAAYGIYKVVFCTICASYDRERMLIKKQNLGKNKLYKPKKRLNIHHEDGKDAVTNLFIFCLVRSNEIISENSRDRPVKREDQVC